MLPISNNPLPKMPEMGHLMAYKKTKLPGWQLSFQRLLLLLLLVFTGFMLLPWTQNVGADGRVTTLRPEQRPQTVHTTLAGRIERWYVMEGQAVRKGDTIVYLSEVKTDYFDPQLLDRMARQVEAKQRAVGSYGQKAAALSDQMNAMLRELDSKTQQIRRKMDQALLKIESDSIKYLQAQNDLQVASRQYEAARNLYEKGIKSLTDLEEKRLKKQEADTKLVAAENQWNAARNEMDIYRAELKLVASETANKTAKAAGDRFSTISEQFDAEATINKLRLEQENYTKRAAFYYVVAPQDGYIVQCLQPGIGEIVKEGDPIVSIQPAAYQPAAELYVKPMDLPLLSVGNKVRLVFDGWPSFFFSGWPGVSMGTFGGQIVSIDRNISGNGKFRVLIAPDSNEPSWPEALLPGGGARGVTQLNNVPLWYEFWRILNGFPPDLYKQASTEASPKSK